jgi:4-hydroxybenzoate polyprenyltransferase
LIYLVLTTSYSMALKSKPVVDVFLLTALYVLRVVAGGVATGIAPSSWLLAFCVVLLLEPRVREAVHGAHRGRRLAPRARLRSAGRSWMHSIGTSAGFMAVLVLALYVNSPEVGALYSRPQFLWLLCPMLLFWFTRDSGSGQAGAKCTMTPSSTR